MRTIPNVLLVVFLFALLFYSMNMRFNILQKQIEEQTMILEAVGGCD